MKLYISLLLGICFLVMSSTSVSAQDKKPRKSPKASVSQTIGLDTKIEIVFGRPGVKGREIWGKLVPYGLQKNEDGAGEVPWRGGANENTTIEFNKPVKVEGNDLPAGKYGMHFIPGQNEWTVIFSKNNSAWGSGDYKEADDALRVKVTPKKAPQQEWLLYGFEDLADYSATAYLHWAELKVPFKIQAAENL